MRGVPPERGNENLAGRSSSADADMSGFGLKYKKTAWPASHPVFGRDQAGVVPPPSGWTVYDRYAWESACGDGTTGHQKIQGFYDNLEREGFSQAAIQIESILQNTEWSGLSGARVLDAFMMLKGNFPFMLRDKIARQGFIDALPGNSGTSLSRLADQIAIDLVDFQFIKFVCRKQSVAKKPL